MVVHYCWKCCSITPNTYRVQLDMQTHPWCYDCDQEAKPVRCLVCLDQGEVSALGEEIACPRGCRISGIVLDTEKAGDYTLEESTKGDE